MQIRPSILTRVVLESLFLINHIHFFQGNRHFDIKLTLWPIPYLLSSVLQALKFTIMWYWWCYNTGRVSAWYRGCKVIEGRFIGLCRLYFNANVWAVNPISVGVLRIETIQRVTRAVCFPCLLLLTLQIRKLHSLH